MWRPIQPEECASGVLKVIGAPRFFETSVTTLHGITYHETGDINECRIVSSSLALRMLSILSIALNALNQ
jgi:hypothetical protein